MVYWWCISNNMNPKNSPKLKVASCQQFETETQLFEALKRKSSKAYQCLYDQSYGSVAWFVLKNSGTDDDAADYFQNAMATLCVNVNDGSFELRPNTKISTYLIEICRRQWLNHLNSKQFKMTVASNDEMDILSDDEMTAFDDLSVERLGRLQIVFEKLGQTCQQILRLFYMEDQPLKYIAQQLNSTEGTVKVSRHRCLEQLKKQF